MFLKDCCSEVRNTCLLEIKTRFAFIRQLPSAIFSLQCWRQFSWLRAQSKAGFRAQRFEFLFFDNLFSAVHVIFNLLRLLMILIAAPEIRRFPPRDSESGLQSAAQHVEVFVVSGGCAIFGAQEQGWD